jgi:arylsulfatase A-like enzyme
VVVYASLLDAADDEHRLWEGRYAEAASDAVEVELEDWTGELARLRLGVTGPGNAMVEWRAARITGTRGVESARLPRIERAPPPRSGRLGRPDLLIVMLDAARADAFSPWGGPASSPAMERLAAGGTVFERALAPSPWTGQSVPAMFTGFYPDTLGYATWGSPIPGEASTLAELLAEAGYRTVMVTQHPAFQGQKDLRRGFEEMRFADEWAFESLPLPADLFTGDRPTFAFVHLMPPHAPYEAPEPFFGRHTSGYEGEASAAAEELIRFPADRSPEELSVQDVEFIRGRYQENADFADSLLGSLLDRLGARDRFADALIMVVSDHGEAFLEHGRFLHTTDLYREFLHIPWVVKWPSGIEGHAARVEETVSLVDLVPTLIDGLDLPADEAGFQGVSLLPRIFDGEALERPVYAATRGTVDARHAPDPRIMLESEGWKIIYDPLRATAELYDLAADPEERNDLSKELPGRAELMVDALLTQRYINRMLLQAAAPFQRPEELDEEVAEQLRALGYLH